MKKRILVIVIAMLLIAGVIVAVVLLNRGDDDQETDVNGASTETPDITNGEASELTTETLPNGETIVWANGNHQNRSECGTRLVGVIYRGIDLEESIALEESLWHRPGHTIEAWSDLTSILGQPITTRNEAAYIAKQILASEQDSWVENLELMVVEHDPNQDIWIFVFLPNTFDTFTAHFFVSVSGDGELLRMWLW